MRHENHYSSSKISGLISSAHHSPFAQSFKKNNALQSIRQLLSLELAPPKNEGVLQMAERLIKKEREGNVEVREKNWTFKFIVGVSAQAQRSCVRR